MTSLGQYRHHPSSQAFYSDNSPFIEFDDEDDEYSAYFPSGKQARQQSTLLLNYNQQEREQQQQQQLLQRQQLQKQRQTQTTSSPYSLGFGSSGGQRRG